MTRMASKYIGYFIIALCICSHLYAYGIGGGNSDSGGGDNLKNYNNSAWFLEDRDTGKAIKYCLEVTPSFSQSKEELICKIEKAFLDWERYLYQKKILLPYSNEKMSLLTRLQLQSFCDGSEDLAFYFGTDSPSIRKAKQKFVNPTAFAYRTHFDPYKGWSKGFIWVAEAGTVFPQKNLPNWDIPKALYSMILHEVGHVLGNGHIDDTIMRNNIAKITSYESRYLGKIDHEKELVYPRKNYSVPFMRTYNLNEAYLHLSGQEANNKVFSSVKIENGMISPNIILTLKDGSEEKEFNIEIYNRTTPYLINPYDVFRIFYKVNNQVVNKQVGYDRILFHGGLTPKHSNTTIPVIFEYNMSVFAYKISIIVNKKVLLVYEY